MPESELVGTAEAVRITRYSRRTLGRLIAEGDLTPALKLPGDTGAYLFRREDVEALTRANTRSQTAPVGALTGAPDDSAS